MKHPFLEDADFVSRVPLWLLANADINLWFVDIVSPPDGFSNVIVHLKGISFRLVTCCGIMCF